MITGNVIGGVIKTPDTVILVDENGKEYTAVSTGEEVELTATTNDVRLGKVVALSTGVKTGEKEIPVYHTTESRAIILAGRPLKFKLLEYEYTKLQALLCVFNTSISDSVRTEKVVIDDKVYPVNSQEYISSTIIDHDTKSIDLGIINEGNAPIIIRYFTYKEIY